MKVKFLKKIRKRFKVIKNDSRGIDALDHKLKRVPHWIGFHDFMYDMMKENGMGFFKYCEWSDRVFRRKQRIKYYKKTKQTNL